MSFPRLSIFVIICILSTTMDSPMVMAQNDGKVIEPKLGYKVDILEKDDALYFLNNSNYTDSLSIRREAVLITRKNVSTKISQSLQITIDDFKNLQSANALLSIHVNGPMVWLEDTLCFIVGVENVQRDTSPYLTMVVDMKLVKQMALPSYKYSKVYDILSHLNTLIIGLNHTHNTCVLYNYNSGKIKELFNFPGGQTTKLLPHPTLSTFVMLNKTLSNKKSEYTLSSYDFTGQRLWQKDYSSDIYHIPELDIVYINAATLALVSINSGHLAKTAMNPDNPDISPNFAATINVEHILNSNGEVAKQAHVSQYHFDKKDKPSIHLLSDLCIANNPVNNEILVLYQQFLAETESHMASFIIDENLKTKGFRDQDTLLYDAGINNSKPLKVTWHADGSYTVYGRRLYRVSFYLLNSDHIYRTNTNRCMKNGCEQYGCTDPKALNFDPSCSISDGSCVYSSCADNEFELILQSDHSFFYRDTSINEIITNAADVITITGQSDGIKYLKKSIGEMCRTVDVSFLSQIIFRDMYNAQCLPKYNSCYRLSFSNSDTIPIQIPFRIYAQIDYSNIFEHWVTKDFSLNINGFNDEPCEVNSPSKTQIYPNPSSDFITIHKSPSTLVQNKLELYDMNGKLVMSIDVPIEPTYSIPTTSLTNGIYWIRIWSSTESNNMEVLKFIKM